MNLPNKITMVRVILIPVFLVFCYLPFSGSRYIALACFIIASFTDLIDGKIARKRGLITDFGKFMDPLADKCLVTAAMLVLVEWGQMPAWVLAVVIAREFAVSGLRMMAASEGKVIAAAWSGKIKTASTMLCIIVMFLPVPDFVNIVCWLIILITTVWSGIEYFVKNKNAIDWSDL